MNGIEKKLSNIFFTLKETDRIEILGIIPEVKALKAITFSEVKVLLDYLYEQKIENPPFSIDNIGIEEKIEKNNLSDNIKELIRITIPIAKEVQSYLEKHPDSNYSSKIAKKLNSYYLELNDKNNLTTDDIFNELISFVCYDYKNTKLQLTATGIISYYFQLCDIFEK